VNFPIMVLLTIFSLTLTQCSGNNAQRETRYPQLSDSERFALEYPLLGSDNIFVFRNASEIAGILANGRGIVFKGFKECPWCQLYVVFLHDVAREMGIDRIYYLDIREDRRTNSESYQRILSILSGRLQYDDEGRPRVFVPDVSIVSRGRIILRDFVPLEEAAEYSTPEEYWNEKRVSALKERLRAGIHILNQLNRSCDIC